MRLTTLPFKITLLFPLIACLTCDPSLASISEPQESLISQTLYEEKTSVVEGETSQAESAFYRLRELDIDHKIDQEIQLSQVLCNILIKKEACLDLITSFSLKIRIEYPEEEQTFHYYFLYDLLVDLPFYTLQKNCCIPFFSQHKKIYHTYEEASQRCNPQLFVLLDKALCDALKNNSLRQVVQDQKSHLYLQKRLASYGKYLSQPLQKGYFIPNSIMSEEGTLPSVLYVDDISIYKGLCIQGFAGEPVLSYRVYPISSNQYEGNSL